jgi:hypothetical protein
MNGETRLPAAVWAVMGVLGVVFLGWGLAPDAALFTDVLTPRVLLVVASLAKIAYLLAGTLLAFACRDHLGSGNPARPAWALLSAGLLATLVGQMCLAPFQIFAGTSPFPSVADLFYVLAYPFWIVGFVLLLRAYSDAGFPMGSTGERLGIVTTVGVVSALVAVSMLRPVAAAEGAPLDKALTLAYPVLDLVLLMPLALLVRAALRMRGSHVGAVWGLLLAGFVFLVLSDTTFAYLGIFGEEVLDPYLHASYILGYALIAAGSQRQLLLLRS